MYKTIVRFVDLQDDNFVYNVGDEFPRAGKEVSDSRLKELASDKNRRKMALIEKVEETKPEKVEAVENFVVPKKEEETPKKAKEVKSSGRNRKK